MENKKLLFIYYRLFKAGGLTKVLVNLCNELVKEGADVTILIMMEDKSSFYHLDSRVKVCCIDTFSTFEFKRINGGLLTKFKKLKHSLSLRNYLYDFGQWRLLKSWLKKNHKDYDYIVSCYYKLSAQLSLNSDVNFKTFAWEHNSFQHGGFLWFKLLRKYYKNLKGIICINEPGYLSYKSINTNTFLIRNIIGDSYEYLSFKPFSEKKNHMLLVGRLDNQKNISEFLDILSNVDLKDWKVKIVGTGPQYEMLSNKILQLSLDDKVELVGQKTETEVINYQSESKIVCLTSIGEALPTVLIEAMFCGNALIAYDCNFGPSDIINEKNGFLIPLHNKEEFQQKLQYLIDNPDKLKQLAESSFNDSVKWKKTNIAPQWLSLFK
ncbi:glycosyltransferase [Vaginella massiliensis]|uniref:glycosyltransferase n=1 Tax=Vaginella massiliensis TaxID=1816680 RepID=UPI003752FDF3